MDQPRYILEDYTRMGYWWPLVKDIDVPKIIPVNYPPLIEVGACKL